ncbi:hypothetical protein N7456_000445 [Penicillium angulare]|uniref:TauD/TfdA-like domain-containing protein n=1 Tax=Penicillium angulare TaxID=116970 RepID=A0A9W9GC56_9EURO|nr:hypothetical protein N7456_000445 [Penicillium angulare]
MTETLVERADLTRLVGESDLSIEIFDIPNHRLIHGRSFPIGIKPKGDLIGADLDTVLEYISSLAEKDVFNNILTQHGSILFRGFPIQEPEDLSKFTQAFKLPQIHQEVGLSGKRTTYAGGNVKTANEEPPDVKFYYHNEYGRSAHFPGVLFFFSQVVPESGGQTPLLSTIELYDRLREETPEFVDTLIDKGIIGRQYYPAKEDPESQTIGWNWQDSYGFTINPEDSLEEKRRKVEEVLKTRLQAEAEWQPNDALHVIQRLPAFRRIASTDQIVPFNGLGGVYGRQRDRQALKPPHRGIDGGIHLPTTYGDGSKIPQEYLEKLLSISDDIGFLVPWEEGDVAIVDNYTVQHARSPWVGKRSLLVSLWDGHERFLSV